MTQPISANDPYARKRISILDTEMAYVDALSFTHSGVRIPGTCQLVS